MKESGRDEQRGGAPGTRKVRVGKFGAQGIVQINSRGMIIDDEEEEYIIGVGTEQVKVRSGWGLIYV